jgi:V8-like Glu-specific endopeptidase
VTRSPTRSSHLAHAKWIARGPGLALGLLVLSAFGCSHKTDDDAAGASDDIFGGVRDEDGAAKSAVVALRIGKSELCSGALVAPNVVLTARHCVSTSEGDSIVCDENGRSLRGGDIEGDLAPGNITVYLGSSPSYGQRADANAKTIFVPEEKVLCNADIALVVLDRSIEDVTPFKVRLSAPARLGETIRAVGYGKNDGAVAMGTRFRKEGVPVLAIGKSITESKTRLGAREFEVGKSVCDGDSGGPAISEITGAVIGVVSRGGPCNDDSGHVYTTTAGFDALFERAFGAAAAKPSIEPNTPPETAKPKSTTPAPKADDGTQTDKGCSSAGARESGPSIFSVIAIALGAMLLGSRRRRRG